MNMTAGHVVVSEALTIYHPLFLLLLMILGYGLVLKTFKKHEVNYLKAFAYEENHPLKLEDDQHAPLMPEDIIEQVRCYLVATFCSFVTFALFRFLGFTGQAAFIAMSTYLMIPAVYVMYHEVHHEWSIKCLRTTLAAVVVAPKEPQFRELFLTAIITSLAKVLADVFPAVFLVLHLFGLPLVPKFVVSLITLIVTCLPFVLRIVQCIKLGRSKHGKGGGAQYVNGFMNFSTILVTVISSVKLLLKDTWQAKVGMWWLILVEFNSLVSFLWDVNIDWRMGVFEWLPVKPTHPSQVMTGNRQWAYYLIIIGDLGLRTSWALRLSPSFFTSQWIALLLSILEIIRRVAWMAMRVEAKLHELDPTYGVPVRDGALTA